MKKKFLLVGLVAMLGVGAFVASSCSDDDDTCTCNGESISTAGYSSCAEATAAQC